MLDLREPHGADMAQGIGISQREAQNHDIRPRGEETAIKPSMSDIASEIKQERRRAAVDGAGRAGKRSVPSH